MMAQVYALLGGIAFWVLGYWLVGSLRLVGADPAVCGTVEITALGGAIVMFQHAIEPPWGTP